MTTKLFAGLQSLDYNVNEWKMGYFYSYMTLLAKEHILLYPLSFSVLSTQPSLAIILVPRGSPVFLLIKTQAVSPNATVEPSFLHMLRCLDLTTIA